MQVSTSKSEDVFWGRLGVLDPRELLCVEADDTAGAVDTGTKAGGMEYRNGCGRRDGATVGMVMAYGGASICPPAAVKLGTSM